MRKRGLIFVISGPSGSGKTTLIKSLLKDKGLRNIIAKSVSFTTRPKRANEKNRRDYFFIKQERFKALLRGKKIIEWTRYLGYYYGTPKDYLDGELRKGRHIVLCLDTKGARKIKNIYPANSISIFILPPKIEALNERIRSRSRIKKENLLERLNLAKKEIALSQRYDYKIMNDDLQLALKELRDIIFDGIGKYKTLS